MPIFPFSGLCQTPGKYFKGQNHFPAWFCKQWYLLKLSTSLKFEKHRGKACSLEILISKRSKKLILSHIVLSSWSSRCSIPNFEEQESVVFARSGWARNLVISSANQASPQDTHKIGLKLAILLSLSFPTNNLVSSSEMRVYLAIT